MMKVAAIALLCLSSVAAHVEYQVHKEEKAATHERGAEHAHVHQGEGKAAPHERGSRTRPRSETHPLLDLAYDNFVLVAQNLCDGNKTFMFGSCEISFDIADLNATEYEDVYETMCGDHEVILTMEEDVDIPSHALSFHPMSMDWKELIELPESYLEEGEVAGCMFTVFSNLDMDPEKVMEYNKQHPTRRLHGHLSPRSIDARGRCTNIRRLGEGSPDAVPYRGDYSMFPLTKPENRRLSTCTEYKVLKLGIQYDSSFCAQVGGTDAKARSYIHGVIDAMNKYFNVSPLCMKVESCHLSGSCSAGTLDGFVSSSSEFCSNDPGVQGVLEKFTQNLNGNLQGCSSMHFVFGGAHTQRFGGTLGCAFVCTLCDGHSTGANNFVPGQAMIDHVMLLSHEFGHNAGMNADFYPPNPANDETYIMGTGAGHVGFKPDRMQWMIDFVNSRPQCIASAPAGSSPTGPSPTPPSSPTGPSPTPPSSSTCTDSDFTDKDGDNCAAYATNGWCEGAEDYANSAGQHAGMCCDACKSGDSTSTGGSTHTCTDSGFADVDGDNCATYAANGWCEGAEAYANSDGHHAGMCCDACK